MFQVALYIWDEGKGLRLMSVPELCTLPDHSPKAQRCATTVNTHSPLCVGKHNIWKAHSTFTLHQGKFFFYTQHLNAEIFKIHVQHTVCNLQSCTMCHRVVLFSRTKLKLESRNSHLKSQSTTQQVGIVGSDEVLLSVLKCGIPSLP